MYEYTVNISPHQRLASFNLGVAITEQRNFTRLEVLEEDDDFFSNINSDYDDIDNNDDDTRGRHH